MIVCVGILREGFLKRVKMEDDIISMNVDCYNRCMINSIDYDFL